MRQWNDWVPPWEQQQKQRRRRGRNNSSNNHSKRLTMGAGVALEASAVAAVGTAAAAARTRLEPLPSNVADRVKRHAVGRQHLTLSQHDRPASVESEPPAVARFGYSTATSIDDVKEIRHSRRHFAIHGDSKPGQRGTMVLSPVKFDADKHCSSSEVSTPPYPHPERKLAAAVLSTGAPLDFCVNAEHEKMSVNSQAPVPHPNLMTFLGRLLKAGEPSMHIPAQPRSNMRGAIKPYREPQWKKMMGHHRLKTPLAFPKTEKERENFDRQLDLWKENYAKRWQAHETQTRHSSFLKANNRTYVERLEYARSFYKRQQLAMRLGRWQRASRKFRFLRQLESELTQICRNSFGLWSFKYRSKRKKKEKCCQSHSKVVDK